MFRFISRCSSGREAWFLVALTAFAFELIALYFQHVILLKPCVLCIYQRSALFGVMLAGLLGTISSSKPLRYPAIFLWIYSAVKGLKLAWEHTNVMLHPSPFAVCDLFVNFPSWLPLDKWLPSVFIASGDCTEPQWQFLSLVMPQWMLVIFGAFLVMGVLVLFAQLFKPKRRDLFNR